MGFRGRNKQRARGERKYGYESFAAWKERRSAAVKREAKNAAARARRAAKKADA